VLVRFLSVAIVSLVVWQQALMASAAEFESRVKPILVRRCVGCHGPDEAGGNVRLDTLSTDLVNDSAAAETWHDVLNVLNRGEMPPEDAPQLTEAERDVLAGWVTEQIQHAIEVRRSTGGQVVIRRLNRVEYRNTMRDLLGINLNYGRNLPPDTPGDDGFLNNGAALNMSALQLEAYLESARNALKRAIVTYDEPSIAEADQTESVVDKVKQNYSNTLGRSSLFVLRSKEFPDEGEFQIRVRARAVLPDGAPWPQMKVVLGYRADTQTPSEVVGVQEVSNTEFQEFEFRGRIEDFPRQSRTQSKYPGLLVWITNAYDDGKPPLKPVQEVVEVPNPKGKGKPKKQKRMIYPVDPDFPKIEIESVSFKAPIFESWPPAHHTRILFDDPSRDSDEAAYSRTVLERFMRRAYRRPATSDEVDEMADFFKSVRPEFATFEEAMRETLAMVLISPEFLYLVEPSADRSRPLTDNEFASRLSYFLWSSMPDDRLFELADGGTLRQPETLTAQIERMLADPRSWNLVEQFCDHWLDLGGLNRVAINPEFYPGFRNELKAQMQLETQHFFAEVLQQDLSALAFLDADFAMLNQSLAEHYGLAGPRGTGFEKVALPADKRRGGLLTQGAFLLANSTGEDSHAIKRGVWLRERLLDDPPAPPPPNVPTLNAENRDFGKLPLKEQLTVHRENEACARCHRGIDPWGVALEEFGATGLLRDKVQRKSGKKMLSLDVDAQTTLPDGHEVDGIAGLKQYLLAERRDDFARALVSRLLSYGLGRSLELTDRETVDSLTDQFLQNDCNLRTLIQQIAASEPFGSK
jgi:hypothetical protein